MSARAWLAAAVVALCAAAAWRPDPFILTQALCLWPQVPEQLQVPEPPAGDCRAQEVPVNAAVQIQLPGTPAAWSVRDHSHGVVSTRRPYRIANPGRYPGADEIWVFDFVVTHPDSVFIELEESSPVVSPGSLRFWLAVKGGQD